MVFALSVHDQECRRTSGTRKNSKRVCIYGFGRSDYSDVVDKGSRNTAGRLPFLKTAALFHSFISQFRTF